MNMLFWWGGAVEGQSTPKAETLCFVPRALPFWTCRFGAGVCRV